MWFYTSGLEVVFQNIPKMLNYQNIGNAKCMSFTLWHCKQSGWNSNKMFGTWKYIFHSKIMNLFISQLLLLPTPGHWVHFEQPDNFKGN